MLLWLIVSGCAVAQTDARSSIAMLAPFEGRYREVGYAALYPARLALKDSTDIDLLPIDDGGSAQTAVERARALALTPEVKAVILIGPHATSDDVQGALNDIPAIIIGEWGSRPATDMVFVLSNPEIAERVETDPLVEMALETAPLTGGDTLGLVGFQEIRGQTQGNFDDVTLLTSGAPASEAFTAEILDSDPFAVAPNHLGLLVYDATDMLAHLLSDIHPTRDNLSTQIRQIDYAAISGRIQFNDGYWVDAPINTYTFSTDGELIKAARP